MLPLEFFENNLSNCKKHFILFLNNSSSMNLFIWYNQIIFQGCNSFSPEPIWSPDFRSPTSCPYGQMVPKNLVPMDKWSPTNLVPLDKRSSSNLVPMDKWSPKIWSPWTNGPPGQMVPNQFGPHTSKSSQLVPVDKLNILGIICPGGPN